MAKIGWIYKEWEEQEDWRFSATEPDSWVYQKQMIVYFDVERN